ncbi:MAG: glycosyltransferase family 4 protein [Isosphaeraceae bacterium]|jgi:glycosyltransferase involved in cell wall biosynthesis
MSNLHNEQPANPSRAKAGQPVIVCTMLGIAPSWKWFAPIFDQIRWEFYGGNPRNWLERKITRPALGSWRSCWESVQFARRRDAALVISHDGRVTSRVAVVARIHRLRAPHVAWGFNFTTLPQGPQRRLMASAFTRVDRFIVYSTLERSLYAEYFRIDPRRIDVVLWGVGYPLVDPPDTPVEPRDYICTLGGNARDYRTLFAAMERLPEIPLVAVLRPENAAGLRVPPNVRLHYLIPSGKANNILAFSRFMVLPLAGANVPCGHVTMVAAMHLKKAMVITNSLGVSDYVQDGVNSLLVPVGDADALAQRIRDLWNDPQRADQLGAAGLAFARANCSEQQIIDHLRRVLQEYGLPT